MLEYVVPIASELERRVSEVFGVSRQLGQLRSMKNPQGAVLGSVIEATLEHKVTDAEISYVAKIEALRSKMEASSDELKIRDFGSGADGHKRSESEQGRFQRVGLGKYCRDTSRRPVTGLLLMKLLCALKPQTAIELGTSVGISAAYQGAALAINRHGKLFTLEGAESVAAVAASNLHYLGLVERTEVIVGRFADTLPELLQRIGPIDYAFIDGHHDYDATLRYFRQIKPSLSASAVVMFDDIAWSSGMAAAWKKIVADPDTGILVDMFSMGLCTLNGPKQVVRIALPRS